MRKLIMKIGLAVTVVMLNTSLVFAGTYGVDKAHSTIGFTVQHMGVSLTRGQFIDYTAEFDFDKNDLSTFYADAVIQVESINTLNEKRDAHLKSPDFFDAATHPTITFKGKKIYEKGSIYEIAGDLTIKGVTKEILLPVVVSGPVKMLDGSEFIGLRGETVINRKDFNVSWSKLLDNGGQAVSDEVTLVIEIEAKAE